MASVKNIVVLSVALSMYLVSVIGVGRYSCHCDHAAQVSFFGIVSKCGCIEEDQHCSAHHKCICGARLEAQKTKKDDCCAVEYKFLKADHFIQDMSFDVVVNVSEILLYDFTPVKEILFIDRPLIKNFHALFRHCGVLIFEKNRQLKL